MIKYVQDHKLVEHTASMGAKLYSSLEHLFTPSSGALNLRGKGDGTFIAWDFPDAKTRDKFVMTMRKNGVQMGPCGDRSVSARIQTAAGRGIKSAKMSLIPHPYRSVSDPC